MLLAHKIALDPNAAQRMYFARAAGAARFAYNWALGEWQKQYKTGGKPSWMSLSKQLNAIKRESLVAQLDRLIKLLQQFRDQLVADKKGKGTRRGKAKV